MVKNKENSYHSLSLLCFNLFFVSLIMVILAYFSILNLDILFNSNILFGVGMLLGFLSLVFWENSKGKWNIHFRAEKHKETIRRDDNLFFRIVPYLFLFLLLIIAVNQFWKNSFITDQMMRITILAITFGAVTFWRNREKVEKEIEGEKVSEEKAELKRANEFDSKFKRLNWFNFNYGVASNWKQKKYFISIFRVLVSPFIWFARLPYSFVKWMYKEGWGYSTCLISIIVLGLVLRLWNLWNLSLWVDEGLSVMVAKRIIEGFGQTLLNGALYPNGIFYHHYLALWLFILKDFPIYFVARLVNAPFFVGINLVLYSFSKKLSNKKTGLISSLLFSLSWLAIDMFDEARFYELFVFCFLFSVFLIFLLVKDMKKFPNPVFLKKHLKELVLLGLFLILSFDSSFLTFLLLYSLSFYFFIEILYNPKKKLNWLCLASCILFISLGVIIMADNLQEATSFIKFTSPYWLTESRPFQEFSSFFLSNSYFEIFLILVGVLIIMKLFIMKSKEINFIFSFILSLYFMVAFQGYGTMTIRYYYFILPFFILLLSLSYFYLRKIDKGKVISVLVILSICLTLNQAFMETKSMAQGNSKIDIKNTNNLEGFNLIKENYLNITQEFVVHHQFGTPFELFFGRTPNYTMGASNLSRDPYLDTINVKLENLTESHKVILIFYKDTSSSFSNLDRLMSEYKVYEKARMVIYYIP